MNEEASQRAWGIRGFQIWANEEDSTSKIVTLTTAEGRHNYVATREQLLRMGEGLVKAAKSMPAAPIG